MGKSRYILVGRGQGKQRFGGEVCQGGTEGVEDIMVVTLLHLYYGFFTWQIIKNAVVKHQLPFRYALVLQTAYFDLKYLVINCRIIFQTIPQRYVHNLKRNWKNLFVSVLRILLICTFLNFIAVFTKKQTFQSLHKSVNFSLIHPTHITIHSF